MISDYNGNVIKYSTSLPFLVGGEERGGRGERELMNDDRF